MLDPCIPNKFIRTPVIPVIHTTLTGQLLPIAWNNVQGFCLLGEDHRLLEPFGTWAIAQGEIGAVLALREVTRRALPPGKIEGDLGLRVDGQFLACTWTTEISCGKNEACGGNRGSEHDGNAVQYHGIRCRKC